MRCRMYRLDQALADINEACALCPSEQEPALAAELWLEKATIQDWSQDFAGSKMSFARAAELAGPVHPHAGNQMSRPGQLPGLRARLDFARARQFIRDQRIDEGVSAMTEAIALARADDDAETLIVALLMLAPSLVLLGHFDDATGAYGEAIERCERSGDRLHRSVAYANRMVLWSFTGQPEEAVADLRKASELAREAGIPLVERIATFNLAEFLYWMGHDDEAFELASRAQRLQTRFVGQKLADDDLLLARIMLSQNRLDAARAQLDQLGLDNPPTDSSPPRVWLYYRYLCLALRDRGMSPGRRPADDAWPDVLRDAQSALSDQERLEILYWYLRGGAGPRAERDAEVQALLPAAPIWRPRIEKLDRETMAGKNR